MGTMLEFCAESSNLRLWWQEENLMLQVYK